MLLSDLVASSNDQLTIYQTNLKRLALASESCH